MSQRLKAVRYSEREGKDSSRSAPRASVSRLTRARILVPEVHPDDKGTMNENPNNPRPEGDVASLSVLPSALRDRARQMARFLRMDTLGDLYVSPFELGPLGKYWIVSTEWSEKQSSRFTIFEDGFIQLFLSYPADVSPWDGPVLPEDQARANLVGDRSWPTDGEDSCSRTHTITWLDDGGYQYDVAVRVSTVRADLH